jgi:hypothetical protein
VRESKRDFNRWVRRIDRNRDGLITRAERRRAARQGWVMHLPRMDGRRVIAVAELRRRHLFATRARFARIDRNGDGWLSPFEWRRA